MKGGDFDLRHSTMMTFELVTPRSPMAFDFLIGSSFVTGCFSLRQYYSLSAPID